MALSWLGQMTESVTLVDPTFEEYRLATERVRRFSDQPISLFDALIAVMSERREGRRWSIDEALRAYRAMGENPDAPGKMEFVDGRFFHSDAQRITMLGWMLELMGADAAVRLGDPDVWRAAVAGLDDDS